MVKSDESGALTRMRRVIAHSALMLLASPIRASPGTNRFSGRIC
jgi:hypothetical protein